MTLSSSYLWLSVEKWNLMECFSTESVSPESFYSERKFGNRLVRHTDVRIDSADYLLLSTEEPSATANCMKVRISSDFINSDLLTPVSKKDKTLFYYPASIYFIKDKVDFYFATQNELDAFIADSRILIQAKGVDKFADNLHIDSHNGKRTIELPSNLMGNAFISFNKQNYLDKDFRINILKGALTGYLCGQMTSVSPEKQKLYMSLSNIKNRLAGLHSNVMMDETASIASQDIEKEISDADNLYSSLKLPETNSFRISRQLALEIAKFTAMRAQVLSKDNSYEAKVRAELEELVAKRDASLSNARLDLDYENQMDILNHIKSQEKAMGKAEGKERKYFPKDSEEYRLKGIAKECIKRYEALEQSCPETQRIIEIEQFLDGSVVKTYNTMIGNLFLQISDLINDLLEKLKNDVSSNSCSLDMVNFCENELQIETGLTAEENLFFNIFLGKILLRTDVETYHSEVTLLQLLVDCSIEFKQSIAGNAQYDKAKAEELLAELRAFYSFLNNDIFEFPIISHFGIQAVISFIMKPILSEQIDHFMLKHNYSRKDLAMLLWGANIGYSDIPKTFTSNMYKTRDTKDVAAFLLSR